MRFSQFCDMVENTEQEQQLLQFLKQDDMKQAEKVFVKLARFPIMGKRFTALTALGNYENLAAFKQSEHYNHIKDWSFAIDFDKKSLYISPNDEQKKKALKILAIIGIVITLIMISRKFCNRRK